MTLKTSEAHKGTEKYNQELLSQIDIKMREKTSMRREELAKKKYLGEIIAEEKPEFGSNNLILAPVGSGKSHLIENLLIPEGFLGKALYLTSNTALKDSLSPDDNNRRKALAENGESIGFYTTGNTNRFGDKPYSVHVMTYHEFGSRVLLPEQTFTSEFDLIFCDEIHSLPKFLSYDNSWELGSAITWISMIHEGKTKYLFTATRDNLDKFDLRLPGLFKHVKEFDYLNHPDIRKYVANSIYNINHLEQLRPHLRSKLQAFDYYGYKGLAFTRLIAEQEKIKEIALEEGFKPLILWSINNERKMDEEQLKAREFILNTGLIPDEYNLLIINGAMQEGWNLYDDKVTLAILDTLDITEQVQALGRVRKDIDILIKKSKEDISNSNLEIHESYLNRPLNTIDKSVLCDELHILDSKGNLRKWPTIKKYLQQSGYKIEDTIKSTKGKRDRVSIITLG